MSDSRSTSVRFVAIDFYRFVAASGVVALHFAIWSKQPADSWLAVSTRDFYLFVDFFFILSGFVIARTYCEMVGNIRAIALYLRRRFARIYPLYFVTLMFFAALSFSGISRYPDRSQHASFVSQLVMMSSWSWNARLPFNLPAWSLSVEWAMYVLFPLLIFICRRFGVWTLLVTIALGFLANQTYLATLPTPLWYLDLNPLRALPTFAIGVLIAETIERFANPYSVWLGFSAFLLAIIMMILHAHIYAIIGIFSISVLLTAGGELVGSPRLFDNSICKALGDASYSVYMLHVIVIMIVIDFLWKKEIAGNEHFPILMFALLVFPFIVGCSILTFKAFERPMRDLISGRKHVLIKTRTRDDMAEIKWDINGPVQKPQR